MQKIYLAKPGGQKEGPYTLEQINRDLAAKKYRDTDFWAWHEGLPSWLPLHSLPGVSAKPPVLAVPDAKPEPSAAETELKPAGSETTLEPTVQEDTIGSAELVAPSETHPEASLPKEPASETAQNVTPPSMSSGRPFSTLDQIFIFTTTDGPSVLQSELTAKVLQETVGKTLANIRAKVAVNVIGGVNTGVMETIGEGTIPTSAWRALHGIKPDVAQRAQDGGYHLCVRTFRIESNGLAALFLMYNKQKS